MEKCLSYNFHIWKNGCHRYRIQIAGHMDLYVKKFFFIYKKGAIQNFGQPGLAIVGIFSLELIGIVIRECF